jgi:hypothetical protein
MATTLEAVIDRAMAEDAGGEEVTFARFLPGTVLSPALAAMVKQCDGVFWMLTAIASWVTCGAAEGADGDSDDGCMNPGMYRSVLHRWPHVRESMQMFELRRHRQTGAELCVRGGADLTADDSETLYPIQRWQYAQIPWSDDPPFCVWASRQQLHSGRAVWLLMLPREH